MVPFRGVAILALDPVPESDLNSFWDFGAIPIPVPDPGKSVFVTAVEVLRFHSPDMDPDLDS